MFLFHLPLKYNAELKKINSRNQKKIKFPEIGRSIQSLILEICHNSGNYYFALDFLILQCILLILKI